ncbi:hypothetical protein [Rhodopila sp.]|uniref:hypothetical protein n=1 Tax=Rhodopila sp. TaxID=2480087 RepID=UPI003D0D306B
MTTEHSSLDTAAALLAGSSMIPAPAVERLRSEVRSGENFLLTSPTAAANFIGNFVVEWGFEVKPAQVPEFHEFLIDNEMTLHQESPDGVSYKGTYAVWAQSAMQLGSYRTIWAFDELADMAKLAHAMANDTEFARLLKRLTAFRDTTIGASRSQQMYQPAASARQT